MKGTGQDLASLEAAVSALQGVKAAEAALEIVRSHLGVYKAATDRATRAELAVCTTALELKRLQSQELLFTQLSLYLVAAAQDWGWEIPEESERALGGLPLSFDAVLALVTGVEDATARAKRAEQRLAVYEAAAEGVNLESYAERGHVIAELSNELHRVQAAYDESRAENEQLEHLISEVRALLHGSAA